MPGKGRPFKKGQSGNAGRRTKRVAGLIALVRQRCGADGQLLVEQLKALAFDPHDNPAIRLAAVKELKTWGWGLPLQPHELSGLDGGPIVTKVVHELRRS